MSSLIRAYIVAKILLSGHNTLTQTGDLFLKYNCLGKFGGKTDWRSHAKWITIKF